MNQLTAFIKTKPFVFAASVLFIAVFFIICNPAELYFLCDDFAHIPQSSKGNFLQTYLLRPVREITLWLDIKLWNMNAVGLHVTNQLLHLANAILSYFLSLVLLKKYTSGNDQKFISFLAALLFLCYAFHSEPILWILGRGGTLAALFIQLSLLLHFKGGILYRVLALLSFVIGLFAYELSWIVPLLLTLFYLYDVYFKKVEKPYLPITAYWYVLSGYLFLRYFALKGTLSGYEFGNVLQNKFLQLLYNFVALTARVFLPPMQNSKVFALLFAILITAFLVLIVYLFKKDRTRFGVVVLLLGCLSISLLPVISLGIDTHDTESERFIYPATIFACMLIVYVFYSIIKNINYFTFAIAGVIMVHLFLLQQSADSYRYASYISKITISALNKQQGVRKLIFTNLPAQYKGGLIFRTGFPVWAPGILNTTYDGVEIRSFKELTKKQKWTTIVERKNTSNPELHVEFRNDTLKLY